MRFYKHEIEFFLIFFRFELKKSSGQVRHCPETGLKWIRYWPP